MSEDFTTPAAPGGRLIQASRAVVLVQRLGLVTGLIEGGFVALQQQAFHAITFASPDARWMAPAAYTLLVGLAAALLLRESGRGQMFQLGTDPNEIDDLAREPRRPVVLDAMCDTLRQLNQPGWGDAPDILAPGTPHLVGS